MGKRSGSKKGSMAFRPRKRADSQMPTVKFWPSVAEKRLCGFACYKAGMTHIGYIDDTESPSKGNEVFASATVLECPPMTVFGVRGYKGGRCVGEIWCQDEKILKELSMKKKKDSKFSASDVDDVFALCFARPGLAGFGKKTPERMEIAVGGKDINEKYEYAMSLLGKEVKISEVFKPGEFVDAIMITTGKGWQGTVKRFGTAVQRRKATGKRRHIGTLGAWHPGYVQYTVPMPGQMGYHKRTELNKRIMKIGQPNEINPKGGFPHYGVVKNEFLLLKGSVGGPVKRLIRLRKAVRKAHSAPKAPEIKYVSLESKQ
ncbi:MAG: 50S ribosomal protein L3 [Candidatus Micrarchaeota archaeon]|nr:50S ribosomal protein L3 [Candidatus Micrarchaeota archaeon]